MDLKLQIVNPMEYPSWDDMLLSTPGHSFFHTSNWAKVLCDSYNYKPVYFTLTDKDRLAVLMPLMEIRSFLTGSRGVSLPFTDYCDPLIDKSIPFDEVLERMIDYGKEAGWRSFELRGAADLLQNTPPFSHYSEHTLQLSKGEEAVFSNFNNNTKRNVKKAVSEGIRTRKSSSIESIEAFYRLNCITRKRHGLPPQPYYFFKNIHKHIISKNNGFVMLASHDGKTIAGAVFFHFGDNGLFKYGASDKRYQSLRANNLIMWEAIKWYCGNGYKNFSFGRTRPENKGLMQFKAGWGGAERTIKYYRYELKKNAFLSVEPRISRIFNRVLNNTPTPLLKIVGSLLYRHVG